MRNTAVGYEGRTELVLKLRLSNLEPSLPGLCIYVNTIWFNPPQQVANSTARPLTAQFIWCRDASTNISVLGFQSKCGVHVWSETLQVWSTGSQGAQGGLISFDGSGHSL